ncbi:hypothetical protein B0T24DRAFT_633184 [Lasiosphaeria ovina]|uniref:Uncharacterized protein n=1 Tax=Lasiosphaeria ovina TaxID=92902 RepID=A0AAE0N531_9PEZI|nr:hypothetical protein B0T24DRAFT_633184 [Lasiosphaeria ovina]
MQGLKQSRSHTQQQTRLLLPEGLGTLANIVALTLDTLTIDCGADKSRLGIRIWNILLIFVIVQAGSTVVAINLTNQANYPPAPSRRQMKCAQCLTA